MLPMTAFLGGGVPARALEAHPEEEERIKACEKELCLMILSRDANGADLKCDLTKTWAKSDLEGGKDKGVSWIFGDAQCSADIKLKRADVIDALTKPKHTIKLPEQAVKCVVERDGETKPVDIQLAPKLKFKDGKADKVWINLGDMSGPADVKGVVATAASLEDTLGIFHKPMIKSINKFMHKQCNKKYGPDAKPEKKAEAKK